MCVAKLLASLTAFTAGFALVALLLDALLPLPEVPEVSDGLAWLDRHRAECDTVFLGSSRVRWQLDPRVFDRILSEQGHPVCSYNFGVEAALIPELSYLLDRLLDLHLPKLRLVVLDLNPLWRGATPLLADDSLRSIYWHDWRHTLIACETAFRPAAAQPLPWATVRGLVRSHLTAMLGHYSHRGRGEFRAWLAEAPPSPARSGPDSRGYYPLAGTMSAEETARFHERLDEMLAREPEAIRHDPVLEREIAALVPKIEAAGALPVFLRMPILQEMRVPAPAPHAGGWPLTLSFDDPREYPALYEAAHWHDNFHLNTAGSEEFAPMVALAIAAQLNRTEHP